MKVYQYGLYEYIRLSAHYIAGQASHSVDVELSGKLKWLPLNFEYHDMMRTGPMT